MLLPRPLPDEVIGSVICRACHRMGLPLKTVLKSIFGTQRSYSSFLLSGDLRELSHRCGLHPEDLLLHHTIFPYATAFMPRPIRELAFAKALDRDRNEESLSSLTKNVSHALAFRRLCRQCITEDVSRFGESYWHREHLLPAVHVCLNHGQRLVQTIVPVRRQAQSTNIALPHHLAGAVQEFDVAPHVLGLLAARSIELLQPNATPTEGATEALRRQALALGFRTRSGDVAGLALATRLSHFFRLPLLADAGCAFDPSERNAWPLLMVRPGISAPFATAKFVFLQVFLAQSPHVGGTLSGNYAKPGKAERDYAQLDSHLALNIEKFARALAQQGRRCTVTQLLDSIGWRATYRHNRHRLPQSRALIQTFRASDQSERQLGRRPRKRSLNTLAKRLANNV